MFRISEESYERVTEILEDIGYACDVEEEYEEWEDVARSSFASVLDELDTNQFDMTCAAISESIHDEYSEGNENYARVFARHFPATFANAGITLISMRTMTNPNFPMMPMRMKSLSMRRKWRYITAGKSTAVAWRSGLRR